MKNKLFAILAVVLIGPLSIMNLSAVDRTQSYTTTEVETGFIFHKVIAQPHSAWTQPGVKSWTPESNVMLLGVALESEIYPETTVVTEGDAILRVEVSKVPEFDQPGAVLGIRSIILCEELIIVDAPGTESILGSPYEQASIMFPQGTGIYLDAGEPLYMNVYTSNKWDYKYRGYGYCIIYYIEIP